MQLISRRKEIGVTLPDPDGPNARAFIVTSQHDTVTWVRGEGMGDVVIFPGGRGEFVPRPYTGIGAFLRHLFGRRTWYWDMTV